MSNNEYIINKKCRLKAAFFVLKRLVSRVIKCFLIKNYYI